MMLLDNFIWIESRGAIFAYVPKVACTNWKCVLRYIEGYDDWLAAHVAHDRKNSGLVFLSQLESGERLLHDNSIAKYAFVRDPYSRVLSAYRNKIEPFASGAASRDRDPFFYDIYRVIKAFTMQDEGADGDVDLCAFLRWIDRSGHELAKNEHWVSQYEILRPDIVKYDYLGRFENLESDADKVLRGLRCDIRFPSQEDVRFPATNSTELIPKYFGVRETELMKRIYKYDFSEFNYETGLKESR